MGKLPGAKRESLDLHRIVQVSGEIGIEDFVRFLTVWRYHTSPIMSYPCQVDLSVELNRRRFHLRDEDGCSGSRCFGEMPKAKKRKQSKVGSSKYVGAGSKTTCVVSPYTRTCLWILTTGGEAATDVSRKRGTQNMTVTTYKLCQLCGDVHSIHVDVDANTAVCFDSLCNAHVTYTWKYI